MSLLWWTLVAVIRGRAAVGGAAHDERDGCPHRGGGRGLVVGVAGDAGVWRRPASRRDESDGQGGGPPGHPRLCRQPRSR